MSVQFIIGSAVEDHTKKLVELSDEWLNQSNEHEVFYLVPNHVKFETEIHVLKELSTLKRHRHSEDIASMRLQVFSFSRLAWYFLQNTEQYQKQTLSQTGKYMLLKQVLILLSDKLTFFQYDISQSGFVEQLVELFDEMQEGLVTSEDLLTVLSQMNQTKSDKDEMIKLSDIQLIYQEYCNQLSQIEADSYEIIPLLVDFLSTKQMKHVLFIVSGFSSFTAIERRLIDTLMQVSGEFKIGLVLDKAYTRKVPEITDLFYHTGKLYFDLYQSARQNKLKLLVDIKLECGSKMQPLDIAWQRSQKVLNQDERKQKTNQEIALSIWKCQDTYSEMVSVGKEIRHLVTNENYRYQDIIVLTRNLDDYQKILGPILNANDIPFYFNQEEKMKYHPLVEFINALFNLKKTFYQSQDVLRFLRMELFFPKSNQCQSITDWQSEMKLFRKKIDYTENVVLQYGYNGLDWIKTNDWEYYDGTNESENNFEREIQTFSNEIRALIKEEVAPFFDKLDQVSTGKEASLLLYQFMIESGVEKQVIFLRDQALEKGELIQAKNHEQTWQAFVNLLDEYTDLMGDSPFVLDDFIQIFKTGLEGSTYTKVPVTLDQVEITSIDLIRAKKSKITFIVGATDSQIPKKIENKTLLSNEERQLLKTSLPDDKHLKMDVASDFAKEPFVFYRALLSATDKIIISYPLETDTSKEFKASPYINVLKNSLDIKETSKRPDFSLGNYRDLDQFSTDEVLLSEWISFKRELVDKKLPTPWLFSQLEKRLLKKLPLKTETLLSSLDYQNIPEQLTEESIQEIYGQTVYASVSKIENFNKCHYKYFLMYGLGLKERAKFELSAATTGEFYHEALDQFFKEIMANHLFLRTMTEQDIQLVTENLLTKIFSQVQFSVLNKTNRMNYIRYQLSKTIERVTFSLKKQSERSNMTPVATEVLFGQILQDKGLASLNFDLSNNRSLKVRGKIDRIDQMSVDNQAYLAVIDYKSSQHTFDFVDAYYGLAMQMVTYIDVALNNAVSLVGKEAKMAGGFYMLVKNPIISPKEDLSEEALSEELLEEFKYEGLLSDNIEVLEKLDNTIEPKVKSLVYPFKQNKTGKLSSKRFVSDKEINWLLDQNRRHFVNAGETIFKGDVQLNPAYKKQKPIACEYCPFRSVCQFDVMLKENNYHKIEKLSKEEMMNKWQEVKENDC